MIHRATADFWTDYRALPANIRARADKQFALLKNNPQHPSLQFKKLGDRNEQKTWSARATLKYLVPVQPARVFVRVTPPPKHAKGLR